MAVRLGLDTRYVHLSYIQLQSGKQTFEKQRVHVNVGYFSTVIILYHSLMVLLMSYQMIHLLIMKVNQNKRRELSSKKLVAQKNFESLVQSQDSEPF